MSADNAGCPRANVVSRNAGVTTVEPDKTGPAKAACSGAGMGSDSSCQTAVLSDIIPDGSTPEPDDRTSASVAQPSEIIDRKSTRLNSSHVSNSYAVCG